MDIYDDMFSWPWRHHCPQK